MSAMLPRLSRCELLRPLGGIHDDVVRAVRIANAVPVISCGEESEDVSEVSGARMEAFASRQSRPVLDVEGIPHRRVNVNLERDAAHDSTAPTMSLHDVESDHGSIGDPFM